jgi:hypothetical protein
MEEEEEVGAAFIVMYLQLLLGGPRFTFVLFKREVCMSGGDKLS